MADSARSIRDFARRSTGLEAENIDADILVFELTPNNSHEFKSLLDENLKRNIPAIIIVHPSVKSAYPRHWNSLRESYKNEFRVINFSWSREAFEKAVSQEICRCGLDAVSKLKISLRSAYGSEDVDGWLDQFKSFGVPDFGTAICLCINIIDRGKLRRKLGIKTDNQREFAHCSVFSHEGSDLEIVRELHSVFGIPFSCFKLIELVNACKRDSLIHLLLDTIHSGEQFIEKIGAFDKERKETLIDKIVHKNLRIHVRVVHYTTWGLHKITAWLKEKSACHLFIFDVESSTKTDNLVLLDGGDSIKEPELKLKLVQLGFDHSFICKIILFCKKIGAQLKQAEDSEVFPDNLVGLGGYNLGLTTMVCAHPGKAVLPVIRLSGLVSHLVQESTFTVYWRSLINHSNTSGAG